MEAMYADLEHGYDMAANSNILRDVLNDQAVKQGIRKQDDPENNLGNELVDLLLSRMQYISHEINEGRWEYQDKYITGERGAAR